MAMRVSKKRFRECGSGARPPSRRILAFGVPPARNAAGLPLPGVRSPRPGAAKGQSGSLVRTAPRRSRTRRVVLGDGGPLAATGPHDLLPYTPRPSAPGEPTVHFHVQTADPGSTPALSVGGARGHRGRQRRSHGRRPIARKLTKRAGKCHFFLSLRLLGSPWNSERSRQPGEERRRRGEPLTQGRARERGGPGASSAFVCGRGAGALCPAGPSPGARRAPAGARTARSAAPAPAASLAPARVLAAPLSAAAPPRAGPRPQPAGPPPAAAAGARGSPALGGRGRLPPSRSRLPPPASPGSVPPRCSWAERAQC
ncbi:unnamed protein product, partial [Rangifer tarandus platyrhynchus]|uniref:Uncharacterized protein n=1 Tax=Rangifer tarandus platyrhynchus TaxID=3082113 RepID=A0AC59Z3N1_RANTA